MDPRLLKEGVYSNSRLVHSCFLLAGCKVQLKTCKGQDYTGVFEGLAPKELYVLKAVAEHTDDNPEGMPAKDNMQDTMMFPIGKTMVMTARDVDMSFGVRRDTFTDAAIVRSMGASNGGPKKLTRWEDENDSGALESLEAGGSSNGWSVDEMFRVNQTKFKVTSSFDPDLTQYTTPLRKEDTLEYKQREAEAQMIADEIQQSEVYKHNIALELEGEDEALFSAVRRPTSGRGNREGFNRGGRGAGSNGVRGRGEVSTEGKYIPPHRQSRPRASDNTDSQSAASETKAVVSSSGVRSSPVQPEPKPVAVSILELKRESATGPPAESAEQAPQHGSQRKHDRALRQFQSDFKLQLGADDKEAASAAAAAAPPQNPPTTLNAPPTKPTTASVSVKAVDAPKPQRVPQPRQGPPPQGGKGQPSHQGQPHHGQPPHQAPPYQGQTQQGPPYQGQAQQPQSYQGQTQQAQPYQGQTQQAPPYQGQQQQAPPYQGQTQQAPPYQGQQQAPPYQGQQQQAPYQGQQQQTFQGQLQQVPSHQGHLQQQGPTHHGQQASPYQGQMQQGPPHHGQQAPPHPGQMQQVPSHPGQGQHGPPHPGQLQQQQQQPPPQQVLAHQQPGVAHPVAHPVPSHHQVAHPGPLQAHHTAAQMQHLQGAPPPLMQGPPPQHLLHPQPSSSPPDDSQQMGVHAMQSLPVSYMYPPGQPAPQFYQMQPRGMNPQALVKMPQQSTSSGKVVNVTQPPPSLMAQQVQPSTSVSRTLVDPSLQNQQGTKDSPREDNKPEQEKGTDGGKATALNPLAQEFVPKFSQQRSATPVSQPQYQMVAPHQGHPEYQQQGQVMMITQGQSMASQPATPQSPIPHQQHPGYYQIQRVSQMQQQEVNPAQVIGQPIISSPTGVMYYNTSHQQLMKAMPDSQGQYGMAPMQQAMTFSQTPVPGHYPAQYGYFVGHPMAQAYGPTQVTHTDHGHQGRPPAGVMVLQGAGPQYQQMAAMPGAGQMIGNGQQMTSMFYPPGSNAHGHQ